LAIATEIELQVKGGVEEEPNGRGGQGIPAGPWGWLAPNVLSVPYNWGVYKNKDTQEKGGERGGTRYKKRAWWWKGQRFTTNILISMGNSAERRELV